MPHSKQACLGGSGVQRLQTTAPGRQAGASGFRGDVGTVPTLLVLADQENPSAQENQECQLAPAVRVGHRGLLVSLLALLALLALTDQENLSAQVNQEYQQDPVVQEGRKDR